MIRTVGKVLLAIIVGFLAVNLLFGGKGEESTDIPTLVKEGALIIDTRSKSEYRNGHVKGAINIPYDVIAAEISQHENDRSKQIIVYCRSGRRSSFAKGYLFDAGYTNVVDAGSIGNMQSNLPK